MSRKEPLGNVCAIDTNVFIDVPKAAELLLEEGYTVIVPWEVHRELNKKKRDPKIKKNAQQALKSLSRIESERLVFANVDWNEAEKAHPSGIMDHKNPDDKILATALSEYRRRANGNGNSRIVYYTHDIGVIDKAKRMHFGENYCLEVREWHEDRGVSVENLAMPTITLPREVVKSKEFKGVIPLKHAADAKKVPENGGAYIISDDGKGTQVNYVGMRKKDSLYLLDQNSEIFGVSQFPVKDNGDWHINWEQILAINLLQDTTIDYLSFLGGAGTGKTFLALACAFNCLEKNGSYGRSYDRIFVTRPPMPSGKTLGYAPGPVEDKMGHWVQGIYDNIEALKQFKPESAKKIDTWVKGPGAESDEESKRNDRRKKVEVLSLEHMRGRNITNSVIIIDELQNVSPQDTLTYVTRLAEGSRMILTGDPHQIDNEYLTEDRNGLTWFTKLMWDHPRFAYTYFTHSVRHPAVKAVLDRLKMQKSSFY